MLWMAVATTGNDKSRNKKMHYFTYLSKHYSTYILAFWRQLVYYIEAHVSAEKALLPFYENRENNIL
jgi:hypothetical protein